MRYKDKHFLESISLALTGLWVAFIRERHLQAHVLITVIVVILGWWSTLSWHEWIVLILVIGLVLVTELLNTAIELTVDLFTRQQKLRAKLAKDVAAGAVLVATVVAIVIGGLLFYNKWVGH